MPAVNCPNCREVLDIPGEFVGRDVRCAVCQKVFTVPMTMSERTIPVVNRSELPSRPDLQDEQETDEQPKRRRASGGSFGLVLILLGFLSCCGLGCGGFTLLVVMVANPSFQPYTAPDGTFSAVFPGKVTAKADDNPDQKKAFSVEARRKLPPEFYFVKHAELPKGDAPELVLKAEADRSVREVAGGIEMRRSEKTVDGYPAIDLMIEHASGQQVTLVRHIVVGKRLYSVGIIGPHGLDFPIDYVDRFFSGFQVLKKE